MMLLDDFYTVQKLNSIDVNTFEMFVELNKNHQLLKGHFPDFPVAPGVAMLQIIKNGMETHLSQTLQVQSSITIKFLNLVNPNDENLLVFNNQYTIENELVKVKNSTTFKDGRSVLKCNVTFVKK